MRKVNAQAAAKAIYDRMCEFIGGDHEGHCIEKVLIPWIEADEVTISTLQNALKSIKDDYEFCQIENDKPDRAHAYYETACKALTQEKIT